MSSDEIVRGLLTVLGPTGFVTLLVWFLQGRSRKAEAEAKDREQDAAEVRDITDGWAEFTKPLREELRELRGEISPLREKVRELRSEIDRLEAQHRDNQHRIDRLERELAETRAVLDDSLALNLQFQQWVDAGAEPPPPTAQTTRLRERLDHIRDHRPRPGVS